MLPQDTRHEQIEYRVVLVRSGSHAIWVQSDGGALRLPRVTIPRWTRPAEQLQQILKNVWHLRGIVLDVLPGKTGSAPCAVMEILSPGSGDGFAAAASEDITEQEMASDEREAVKAILAGKVGARGPFSRIGWIQEAMQWLRAELGHEIAFTDDVRQYNAAGGFALVRFATKDGRAYWLKATGKPNVHEFHITRMLAELCPEFLPHRIAEREDWNAWLMEDAGQPVQSWTLPALEQAVSSMATLQQKAITQTREFLAVGAFDQRLCVLRTHLAELVEYLDEAMAKQTSKKVLRIEANRLRQLSSLLQDACFHMEALEIPDTLVHNDINSGNILFEGTRCVFTDWCEAGVGSPFFAFQYLCLLEAHGNGDWAPSLRKLYKQCWLDRLSASQIDQAFALTPLLAILAYLYGRGTWLHSLKRNDPHVESYARSLARHIDRAAQDPQLLEVLCH